MRAGVLQALPAILSSGAGSRPGGRLTFLCFAKEKEAKEKRPRGLRPAAKLRATCAGWVLQGTAGHPIPPPGAAAKHILRTFAKWRKNKGIGPLHFQTDLRFSAVNLHPDRCNTHPTTASGVRWVSDVAPYWRRLGGQTFSSVTNCFCQRALRVKANCLGMEKGCVPYYLATHQHGTRLESTKVLTLCLF